MNWATQHTTSTTQSGKGPLLACLRGLGNRRASNASSSMSSGSGQDSPAALARRT